MRGHQVRRLALRCDGATLAAELHTLGGSGTRTLVCFIPGGTTDPSRSRPITSPWEHQQLGALAAAGCDGLTLNFPGVGQSAGNLADNTLERRGRWIEAALAAAAAPSGTTPVVLVGCSMGAHVAALLTTTLPIRALALVAPAAYGAAAVDEPFGPRFAAAIRRAGSWCDSPAFGALRRFSGPVLLLLPADDAVIPRPVTAAILGAAGDADVVWLRGAAHRVLSSPAPADRRAREEICGRIARLAATVTPGRVRALGPVVAPCAVASLPPTI